MTCDANVNPMPASRAKSILFLLLVFTVLHAKAQLVSVTPEQQTILLSALKDELNRNLTELESPGMQKPFYMAYTLVWGQEFSCTAKAGILYEKRINPVTDGSLRLMIGSYELNDENFEDENEYNGNPSPLQQLNMLPQEVDYWAVRRFFWQTTDDVFRSANEHYKHKLEVIAKKGGSYNPDGLKDFSEVKPVVKTIPAVKLSTDLDQLAGRMKQVSAYFRGDTTVISSTVQLNLSNTMTYYLNSEGTELHIPSTTYSLSIQATTLDPEGIENYESIHFEGLTPEEIPTDPELLDACSIIMGKLRNQQHLDTIPEDYHGPVLYEGVTAANYFKRYFFDGKNTLIARREPLKDENYRQVVRQNDNDQQKYNKKLFSKELSVVDISNTSEFDGVPLYGHYTMDAEGVSPQPDLLLVENGILKNLLNNRIPTHNQQEPNGHSRFSGMSVSSEIAPGVLKITTSNGKSLPELKKILVDEAAEQNLEYAIIIRPQMVGTHYCGLQYFRINVADMTEQPVLETVNPGDQWSNKQQDRILGISGQLVLRNSFFDFGQGIPVSYIVPAGVVIDQAAFSFNRHMDYRVSRRIVPYPPKGK